MRRMSSTTYIHGKQVLAYGWQKAGSMCKGRDACKRLCVHARYPIEGEQPFVEVWVQCNDKAAAVKGWWLVHIRAQIRAQSSAVNYMWPENAVAHRHIDRYTKDLVKQLRDNNVGVGKVFSIVGSLFGAAENVPFTKRSLKTLCRKLNRGQLDFDAVKTMNMLAEMKANDPDFNYTVQVDEESRIKTLMWVTSRGCDQYRCFGDAITFDTTYRTNLYDMPFGLFVGANNHFQSIIFGGAMMRDEKEETFKWIFKEFVRMVGGKHP